MVLIALVALTVLPAMQDDGVWISFWNDKPVTHTGLLSFGP
jgi:hypothetical protein